MQLKGRYRPGKKVFFMNCGIHAREWVSPATCMYIIRQVRAPLVIRALRQSRQRWGRSRIKKKRRIIFLVRISRMARCVYRLLSLPICLYQNCLLTSVNRWRPVGCLINKPKVLQKVLPKYVFDRSQSKVSHLVFVLIFPSDSFQIR